MKHHRPLRDRWPFLLLPLLALGCASVPTPAPTGGEETAATALLEASIEAHGGDLYQELDNIAVAYDGRWGRLIQRIQPVLTDSGYRKSSEERLIFDEDLLLQRHQGPDGVKIVERRGTDAVTVTYLPDLAPGVSKATAERRPADAEESAASALVADAYKMFLLGPSFLKRRAAELETLAPETIDGKIYDRLVARLVPGFGPGPEDRVVAWIDRDTHRLFRVLFTLDGLESTRGAAVDVTFHDHRRQGGYLWPTRFVERVRKPLKIFAHEWNMVGLDLDRPRAQAEPTDLLHLVDQPAKRFGGGGAENGSPSSQPTRP